MLISHICFNQSLTPGSEYPETWVHAPNYIWQTGVAPCLNSNSQAPNMNHHAHMYTWNTTVVKIPPMPRE